MKRSVAVLVSLIVTASVFAQDQRTIKRDLIRELLNVMDTKALTQSSFDVIFHRLEQPASEAAMKDASDEERKQYAASAKIYSDQIRVFKERLYARIDYAKYAEETYAPIFEKNFTADELRELIAFYKTPVGQKSSRTLAEFTVGGLIRGGETVAELSAAIRDELEAEDKAAHPWKSTMADLRTVATATEAYATDDNKYPNVKSYEELGSILSPTYIRKMPEKDAWGTPFMYVVSADGQHYKFVSAGADKHFDWNATTIESLPENYKGRASESLDADIVFQDGQFIQYPSASAKNPE